MQRLRTINMLREEWKSILNKQNFLRVKHKYQFVGKTKSYQVQKRFPLPFIFLYQLTNVAIFIV